MVDGLDARDRSVSVIHADCAPLRRMAVFDVLVNNADRKGGHILGSGGHVFGVDHGVCFNTDPKLRTLLWGWAGAELTDDELAAVRRVRDETPDRLYELLAEPEIEELWSRAERLLRRGRFPRPRSGHYPPFPGPPSDRSLVTGTYPTPRVLEPSRSREWAAAGGCCARRIGWPACTHGPRPRCLSSIPSRSGPDSSLFDTAQQQPVPAGPQPADGRPARLYVCGITPYDATHIGHANTYVAFDLLNRVWRDAGLDVDYVQNVTDVDDPLLERAIRDGIDWQQLAADQTELFRTDMTALNVIPPAHYVGAVESIGEVVELIGELQVKGAVYPVDDADYPDLYFARSTDHDFGSLSHLARHRGVGGLRRAGR